MKASISIIVCFYNAGDKLYKTCDSIKGLLLDDLENVEVIFVNNNSNDNSVEIINNLFESFSLFPWKIVNEPKPGLSYARLRGIASSQYEYLLFCDDDNWLSKDYLQIGSKILQNDSLIAVLGGKGAAVSEIELPVWFEQNKNFFAVGEQFTESGQVKGYRNVVYGAGMFVRKSAFQFLISKGFQFYNLGRTGKKLSSGEDGEMCLAFQIAGYKIWYDENLIFQHFIDPKRLSDNYLQKLKKGMHTSNYVTKFYRNYLFGYKPNITSFFWFKEFFYSIFYSLKNIKRFDFSFYYYLFRQREKYSNDIKKLIIFCEKIDINNMNS